MTANTIKETFFSEKGKIDFYQQVSTSLSEGMILKNFEHLCNILNIESVSNGNVRKRYQNVFSCFFEWHKIESSFRIKIDKIYPFDEIKGYESPTSHGKVKGTDYKPRFTYQDYILPLLQDYAYSQQTPYYITYTSFDLYTILGFTNSNIQNLSNKIQELSMNHNLTSMMKYPVVFTAIKKVVHYDIILDALNILKNKGYIEKYGQILYLQFEDGTISIATEKQVLNIERIRNDIIEEYKDENKSYSDNTLIQRKVTRLANAKLQKEYHYRIIGIKYYIKFNKDKFIPKSLPEDKKTQYKNILNEKSNNRLKNYLSGTVNSIIKKINKAEERQSRLLSEKKKRANQKYIKEIMTRYNLIGKNSEALLNSFLKILNEYTNLQIENAENTSNYGAVEYDEYVSDEFYLP